MYQSTVILSALLEVIKHIYVIMSAFLYFSVSFAIGILFDYSGIKSIN